LREGILEQGRTAPDRPGHNHREEEEARMTRIETGMAKEIISNMETILYWPDKALLCARYDSGPGAVQAFYADSCGTEISWYWFKLYEEIKNPRKDTARLAVVYESKLTPDEFLKFLVDKKAPVFKMAAQFEQIIKKAMTPELALERTGRGLPAIDFSDSSGGR
jgi:hypothetical protein